MQISKNSRRFILLIIVIVSALTPLYLETLENKGLQLVLLATLISITLAIIVEFYFEYLQNDKKDLPKVYTQEGSLIAEFNKIKRNSSEKCKLFWCGKYSNTFKFEEYFNAEKNLLLNRKMGKNPLIIERVISKDVPKQQVLDHHKIMEEAIKEEVYRYKIGDAGGIEIVTGDYVYSDIQYNTAMIVLFDKGGHPKWGLQFDDKFISENHHIVTGTLDQIWDKAWDSSYPPEEFYPELATGVVPSILNLYDKLNIWDKIAPLYDRYVTNLIPNENQLLVKYQDDEEKILCHLIDEELCLNNVTIIEIGCGTGREIINIAQNYLTSVPDQKFSIKLLLGVDLSKKMIENSIRNFQENISKNLISKYWEDKVKFIIGNVLKLKTILQRENINTKGSTVIVICLLNTLGIIHDENDRNNIITQMARVAGKDGKLFISVFNAQQFSKNAPDIYSQLKEIVGEFDGMESFDIPNNDFYNKTSKYYSHWFTKEEIVDLVKRGIKDTPLNKREINIIEIENIGLVIEV